MRARKRMMMKINQPFILVVGVVGKRGACPVFLRLWGERMRCLREVGYGAVGLA